MHNTTTLPNFHVLIVKTMGWTNTRPTHVKIISERFNQSVKIGFSNEPGSISPTLETAEEWLIKNGHNVIGHGEGKGHYYIICGHVNEAFKQLK